MPVTGINAVEVHYIDQFQTNTALLLQQKGSKLAGTVTIGSHKGDGAAFLEQIGSVEADLITTRHGDTPLEDIATDRRWVYPADYDKAIPLDRQDELRMLIDPTNKYAEALANALGRKKDAVIISALGGTARTGHDGSTSVALPAGQLIANGSVGLTVDKLRNASYLLGEADVDLDVEMPWFIGTQKMKQQLLESTEVTSSDYNSVKALVSGQVDTFMGFRFLWLSATSNAGLVGTSEHFGYAYVPSGVHLGMWNDAMIRVDERADKRYLRQVYGCITMGASRTEEKKVVRVAASV